MTAERSKKRKQAKSYSADGIAVRVILGVTLIAVGVLVTLACVIGMKDGIFGPIGDFVFRMTGSMAWGIPVLLIWGGVVACVSAQRKTHLRPFLIVCLIYVLVCGFLAIVSYLPSDEIGASTAWMDAIWNRNANDQNIFHLAGYYAQAVGRNGGGMLGYVVAWPLWKLAGPIFGAILMVPLIVLAVLWLFHFKPKAFMERLHQRGERAAEKENEKERKREQAVWAQDPRYSQAVQQRSAAQPAPAAYPQAATAQNVQPAYAQPYPSGYGAPAGQAQQPAVRGFAPVPEENAYTPPARESGTRQGRFFSRLFGSHNEPEEEAPLRSSHRRESAPAPDSSPVPAANEPVRNYSDAARTEPQAPPSRPMREVLDRTGRDADTETVPELFQPRRQRTSRVFSPETVVEDPVPPDAVNTERRSRRRRAQSEAEGPAQPEQAPGGLQQPVDSWQDDAPPWDEDIVAPAKPVMPVLKGQTRSDGSALTIKPPRRGAETLGGSKGRKADEQAEQLRMYIAPSLDFLQPAMISAAVSPEEDSVRARRLEETLASFKVDAVVRHITHGPAVSRFELEIAQGIKVSKITSLADNIAMDMQAKSVRIEAPIPGKSLIGVEVPNRSVTTVGLRELLESPAMLEDKDPLTVALGKDIAGTPVTCNLSRMPHLLIAGATGSGKSVCINTIINSLLYRTTPEQVRLILVDPKVVELQCYNGCPHLLLPVVSDPHKASAALAWAVDEMMARYNKFTKASVRSIDGYNAHLPEGEKPMYRLVIIIDELADLMMVCKRDVEERICRIAQLARAAGIHLIVATQRPSVDVITGLIKANIPSRIAFKVTSFVDSRTILDGGGAEQLLGWGDMLYKPMGSFTPTRIQGCFLTDDEVNHITDFIKKNCPAQYDPDIIEMLEHTSDEDPAGTPSTDDFAAEEPQDPGDSSLLAQCIEIAVQDGQVSTSMLQRRLRVGYSRAGRLVDEMEKRGIVSQQDGSKPRICLISREEFEQMKADGEIK